VFGNYGINSIRNAIHNILGEYHHFSIAASQVDIVAHSMGGLMARGFVQQHDYKRKENYMKGSIHLRLNSFFF
jgi:triacylglycerol esterase/lipase EstA (alpha/beta hydrolase family)